MGSSTKLSTAFDLAHHGSPLSKSSSTALQRQMSPRRTSHALPRRGPQGKALLLLHRGWRRCGGSSGDTGSSGGSRSRRRGNWVLLLGLSAERVVVQRSAGRAHAGGGLRSRDGGHIQSFGLGRGGGFGRRRRGRSTGRLGRLVGVGDRRSGLRLRGRWGNWRRGTRGLGG
jgi:hypothetical protein